MFPNVNDDLLMVLIGLAGIVLFIVIVRTLKEPSPRPRWSDEDEEDRLD